jgi:CRP/FNR family transcriptional regulator, anaerobic regulatory protein
MAEQGSAPPIEPPERPRYAAAAAEDLRTGGRRLREAFTQTPQRFAQRDAPLIAASEADAGAVLIRSGVAYRACILADGRRAILDILLPGDMFGIDLVVLAVPGDDLRAARRVGYHVLGAAALRALMRDASVATRMMAILAEARLRAERLAAAIGRLDASARLSVLLLDLHDRLRRSGLIGQASYELPLTQEQVADHLGLTLVHVNRTLRRLREQKIALLGRQVVTIIDIERLRQCARGLPEPPEMIGPPLATERTAE